MWRSCVTGVCVHCVCVCVCVCTLVCALVVVCALNPITAKTVTVVQARHQLEGFNRLDLHIMVQMCVGITIQHVTSSACK